ncbi:AAA family ATPase [Leptolyngbya sp. CCY15150]|uniref:tyrosine-protein kinase family protein n=1 Tax=Leptolyngbya sp. CCY15150 TaxID=2767772 RepID=UPI00195138CB|nr:AAA family ATPase [Leptolyngbya sp. CCY15150]
MISNKPTPLEIESELLQALSAEDLEASVSVKESSLGWLTIQVTTNAFEGKPQIEREEKVDTILDLVNLNLGQYPIASYNLLTPKELEDEPSVSIRLPLWSDILDAPDLQQEVGIDKDVPDRPQIVTFYSFKGGVGRSTALGLVGILLAQRNRRVVIIDFDLEAPGISVLLQPDSLDEQKYGVLDYIYQRFLTPEENVPLIEDCIRQVELASRGELFLVSAGDYDENYVHKLAELDRRAWQSFYKRQVNPVKQLLDDIKNYIDPDVILIDARPGFNDTGAVALLDLADTGIVCFSPTDQSFDGLRWVIKAARKQSKYRGKPDLRFLLTPMPALPEDQLSSWISKAEDWITDHWGLPGDINVGELYYKILYNPGIAVLPNLIGAQASLTSDYLPIADAIDASLPEPRNLEPPIVAGNRELILEELTFIASTAQELQAEHIPTIFQRTGDFPKFLRDRTWLIRGAKGTGKSILFRLFVERPNEARELSNDEFGLNDHIFMAGHGQSRLGSSILDSQNLASYEQAVGESSWDVFWLNYALLQLCINCPDLLDITQIDDDLIRFSNQEQLTQSAIISWFVRRTQSPLSVPQAIDDLRIIDLWLNEHNKYVWLLYDELDVGFGSGAESYERRRRALEALLAWWLESGTALKRISPKIFLREDIWSNLNFVNKGHYAGRSLQLKWEESDLWKLVLRQSLQSSSSLSCTLEQDLGLTLERLEIASLDQLRKGLYPLWGERMGSGKKAYTYNWVRTRISDTNENCFPRSLILLLQEAVNRESSFSTQYSPEIVLRPKSLIEAFPYVSEQRVDEVRNEYPELRDFLSRMRDERSPIDETRLAEILSVSGGELSLLIKDMVEAGILKERSRPRDPPPRVYAVAELYLYGLSMKRKGQR